MKPIHPRDQKIISYWLLTGMVMVYVQIILGGITRLTGSGLSITKWDIVMGTLPPMHQVQWEEAFNFYKQTPQYQHINVGMSLSDFKFIYFWEFLHRLWARSMGLVFVIPFIFFLIRGSLTKTLLRNLSFVIAFASLAALFGWIMVASGLIERPWVNAYKLTIHLALGIMLFLSIFYTWFQHRGFAKRELNTKWKRTSLLLLIICGIQVLFGGIVSGMKAAMNYPTWPTMNGKWIPAAILDGQNWSVDSFLLYDRTSFVPALALFLHRNVAYLLFVLILFFSIRWYRSSNTEWRWVSFVLPAIVVIQAGLGILTNINSVGSIPIAFGSLHQGIGILLLTLLFYIYLVVRPQSQLIHK